MSTADRLNADKLNLDPWLTRIGYRGAKNGGVATLYPDDVGALVALIEAHTNAAVARAGVLLNDAYLRAERAEQALGLEFQQNAVLTVRCLNLASENEQLRKVAAAHSSLKPPSQYVVDDGRIRASDIARAPMSIFRP